MLKLLNVIAKKEIIDALRDSKSLASALLMPMVTAIALFGSINLAVSLQTPSDSIKLPIAGSKNAQPLIERFAEAGIEVVPAPENPEQAIIDQQWDAVVIIPEDFADEFRQQKPAQIELLSDHSRTAAMSKIMKIRAVIEQWSAEIGALRLINRNVDPTIFRVVQVQNINVTSDQRVALKIIGGLPLVIMLTVFSVGIGMASDLAAGERERRSLESLLINPITPTTAFIGKALATFAVAFVISTIGIGLQLIAVNQAPLAELGIRLSMGFGTFILVILLVLPSLVLATAVQLFVSFIARSFKDAQAYNVLVVMIPMVPGMFLMFNSGASEFWQMLVPILGTSALLNDLLSGETPSLLFVLLAGLSAILAAVIFGLMGISFLKREKTILQ
ncbi:ABC transporter permease protein NatB [Thalassocella blandensis]|nr:ABC transporter permease protein NatB [Thalassocella blandensis]